MRIDVYLTYLMAIHMVNSFVENLLIESIMVVESVRVFVSLILISSY